MSEHVLPNEDKALTSSPPPEPQLQFNSPDRSWEHFGLFERVRETLFALPSFFKSDLIISGVLATDLFTFNSSLGATIEAQVAHALNELRSTWDPEQKYTRYYFVRQPQTFPDVTLRAAAPKVDPSILLGIELKGWYVLSKEREPSFRYKVSPRVCAPADLLVVYPWALSNVISGSPQLFQPYITSARYAAEYRNWHWQYKKTGGGHNEVKFSGASGFYPIKADPISDEASNDKGGNFGRFARTGLMEAYITKLFREELSGIPLDAWQKFLAIFSESRSEDKITNVLDRIAVAASKIGESPSDRTIAQIKANLLEIASLLQLE